jgi:hypothetical protein
MLQRARAIRTAEEEKWNSPKGVKVETVAERKVRLFDAAKEKAKSDLEKQYPAGPVKIETDAAKAERLYYKKDPPER